MARVALVTGGTRGIGASICKALKAAGYKVAANYGGNDAAAEKFKAETGISVYKWDVSAFEACAEGVKKVEAELGPIEILVNNAGQAASAPFLKTDPSLWRRMMAVNLDGTFHCAQAALPDMLAAGWGRIVNIASTAGLTGYGYISAYCASKHGVVGLTRALALEVATKGITVNAVCPGYTDTDMVKDTVANIVAKTGRTPDQALAEITSRNPQKRLIKPEEVANAVAWLCLPGTEAITGQAIAISGGEVM
jgi:NAD(P)-dependent dehydrogenase (short-subunit alcohol dehydrogenase family)